MPRTTGPRRWTTPDDVVRKLRRRWDDGTYRHGRPSAITFAPDGRMFVGNDNDGSIMWIAPLELE